MRLLLTSCWVNLLLLAVAHYPEQGMELCFVCLFFFFLPGPAEEGRPIPSRLWETVTSYTFIDDVMSKNRVQHSQHVKLKETIHCHS